MSDTRPIPGLDGYFATADGLIISRKSWKELVRSPRVDKWGYQTLVLSGRSFFVHRLVLLAFVGPCPDGLVTRHLDGDAKNNAVSNLAYGTHQQNMEDRRAHGRNAFGARNSNAKLTDDLVTEIRRKCVDSPRARRTLASRFGVSADTIRAILNRKTWRHLV